jgi:hypothetical protein
MVLASAMTDIPTEILREVLRQCSSSPLQTNAAWNFPWNLGQVCSHWRALFFSMRSTFWNKIVIEETYDGFQSKSGKVQQILAFFIDCTHGEPFSFAFCMERRFDHLRPVLADLYAHSEQWEEASFRMWSHDLEHLYSVNGRLPLLKKLEISVEWDPPQFSMRRDILTNVFEDAPLLTHVVLSDHGWQFNFDWSSLTIVDFKYLGDCERTLAILRETTNLVELSLLCSLRKRLHIEGGELIHLPRLERLSVDWAPLLTVLETPSLQHLKIVLDPRQLDNFNEAHITLDFLHRSGFKLNTFLIKSESQAAVVKEILRCMPKVDRLILLDVPDHVFHWLAYTRTQELRFSNLIVLGYSMMSQIRVLKALHDMIARRNLPGGVRDPSPKEVIIGTPWVQADRPLAANLQSLCGARGIRFGFIHEMSILPWGLGLD